MYHSSNAPPYSHWRGKTMALLRHTRGHEGQTKEIDFITPFYRQQHNRDTLIKSIDSLLASEYLSIRAIPFGSDRPPLNWFPNKSSITRNISLIAANEGVQLFQLTYCFRAGDEEKKEEGHFFIYEHPEYRKVFIAITIESSNFFQRALFPFIQSLHPRAIMTFITHKRLRRLLDQFQVANQFTDLIITRASYRLRFENEGKHKKIVPMVSWPDMGLSEAFDWVYQNNGWFQSLQFEARRDHLVAAEVSFTRQGVVRTNQLLSKVFEGFVSPVCKIIHENMEIFAHRSRRDYHDLTAKPLAIDFGTVQFPDPSENARFIQAMKRLQTASVSILHGNPYIHMTVIDYYDASTFDLWVLNPSQLVIVPQLKGSIPAIKRLINHIFDTYAEGKITNYTGVEI
jgi:hypothetical protein